MLATLEAPKSLVRGLRNCVGAQHVYHRPADLAAYAYDASGASGDRALPLAVVFPASADEVAAVVAECASSHVPIIPRGAGTGYSGGAVGAGAVVVSTVRLNKIAPPDVARRLIHCEAGVITAQIHAAAAAADLYYPPDPGSSTTSTIGGNVACNASGPHGLRYGATADYVAALSVVLADGRRLEVGETHGEGFDLANLMCGSEGTLAFITDVTLRLLPAPAARATLLAIFNDMQTAADSVSRIAEAGVVPAALECMDAASVDAVRNSGVAEVPEGVGALVIAEIEGDPKGTDREADLVRSALLKAGAGRVEHAKGPEEATRLWAVRKAISAAVATIMIGKVNEDVVVPRHRVGELAKAVQAIGAKHAVPALLFGHLGEGNMHVTFLMDPRVRGERKLADAAASDLFATVLAMEGSITGEHGVGTMKLAWPERQLGPGTMALMRRIKANLDPQSILNPGKKLPG